MPAAFRARDKLSHPATSAPLAVGVGVALVVFAAFGLVTGRVDRVAGSVGNRVSVSNLTCVHSLGLPYVLGPVVKPVDRDGVQVFHVDASAGRFEPNDLSAESGRPIEIRLSRGRGCAEEIDFDDLSVHAQLRDGGAVLRLPALGPGIHPFRCELGKIAGILVVR